MRAGMKWVAGMACLATCAAYGEFQAPSEEQLAQAADNPSLVVGLIVDGTIPQIAEVGKNVIVRIVRLDLEPEERDSRITSLVTHLFHALPNDQELLASFLAKFVAASPAASMSPAIVSAIQRSIIVVYGVHVANVFGNAYNLAMQTVAGAPGGGKTVPPQPPPPPVALPLRPPVAELYEGQQLP